MNAENSLMGAVWKIVDSELSRRRMPWAELGRAIGTTDQTMNNWSRRSIPASRYADIARAFGWTVEQVIGVAPAPAVAAAVSADPEATYSKRAHDIAGLFDQLKDPAVRQSAYAGVMILLQMAKAGQRLDAAAEPVPTEETTPLLVPAPNPPLREHR